MGRDCNGSKALMVREGDEQRYGGPVMRKHMISISIFRDSSR